MPTDVLNVLLHECSDSAAFHWITCGSIFSIDNVLVADGGIQSCSMTALGISKLLSTFFNFTGVTSSAIGCPLGETVAVSGPSCSVLQTG